jgi:hypothetical protein
VVQPARRRNGKAGIEQFSECHSFTQGIDSLCFLRSLNAGFWILDSGFWIVARYPFRKKKASLRKFSHLFKHSLTLVIFSARYKAIKHCHCCWCLSSMYLLRATAVSSPLVVPTKLDRFWFLFLIGEPTAAVSSRFSPAKPSHSCFRFS